MIKPKLYEHAQSYFTHTLCSKSWIGALQILVKVSNSVFKHTQLLLPSAIKKRKKFNFLDFTPISISANDVFVGFVILSSNEKFGYQSKKKLFYAVDYASVIEYSPDIDTYKYTSLLKIIYIGSGAV